MVDPLLRSATASSAFLNSLEPPRSTFGARDGFPDVAVEYFAHSRLLFRKNCCRPAVQCTPKCSWGRLMLIAFRDSDNAETRSAVIMVRQKFTIQKKYIGWTEIIPPDHPLFRTRELRVVHQRSGLFLETDGSSPTDHLRYLNLATCSFDAKKESTKILME